MKYFKYLSPLLVLLMLLSCVDTSMNVPDPNPDPDPDPLPGSEALVYFWFFGGDIPNNIELERVDATFPAGNEAFLSFISALDGYPDTGRKASMERRNAPTDLNYRPQGNGGREYQEGEMRAIQIRAPFTGPNGENTMIFHAPSSGFRDLVFSLAAKDEGSAEALVFDYSVSGSGNWTNEGLAQPVQNLETDVYRLFVVDFSEIEAVNDNPEFKIRVRFDGPSRDEDNGTRVTFNNIALDGVSLSVSEASALSFSDVNNGEAVFAGEPFSVLVQTVGEDGRPVEADSDTSVFLTLASGTGSLSGTLEGTVAAGESAVRINGLLYDTVEEGVSIEAASGGLASAVSETFAVQSRTFTVSLSVNPVGAGTVEGAGSYAAGEQVTIKAIPNAGFSFLIWTEGDEGDVFSTTAEQTFEMPERNLTVIANFIGEAEAETITRWTFDGTLDAAEGAGTAQLIGGTETHSTTVESGWRMTAFPEQFTASGTAGVEFMAGTAGFFDIQVSMGHRASGTMSRWAEFQYTTDGGASWQRYGDNNAALSPHDTVTEYLLDFSDVAGVSDNPDFGVRIVSVFSPVAFNPEEPDENFAANTAYHRARTEGTGGGAYSGGGNWRFLDVTVTGKSR
ncbi:MAG: hypothetical protein JJU35_08615 [Balneolales bacterium]|nr:hypothetical protein [Balneolales bacterium]